MIYGQVERLLMQALLDPDFRKEIVAIGPSAGARFACDTGEAQVLGALLADDGAGLAAVLSVLDSAIDVRLSLGLYGQPPHELTEGHLSRRGFADHNTAMNAHAG